MREERDSVEALSRVLVSAPSGQHIPLGQLVSFEYVRGPQVIKSEDTFKTAYITFGAEKGFSEVDVVEQASADLAERAATGQLHLPAGVTYEFAGDYENQARSERRLTILIPVALVIVFFLLYLQFKRTSTTLIIYSGVAIAVAGGFILVWLYGRPGFFDFSFLGADMRDLFQVGTIKLSVAVWVGVIALIGIATDNGVVMATYLDQQMASGSVQSLDDIHDRVMIAGERRVRACLMTTATTILALLPVVTSQGRGSDVMVPMAIPVLGGIWVALLSLFVVPVLYSWVEESKWRWAQRRLGR